MLRSALMLALVTLTWTACSDEAAPEAARGTGEPAQPAPVPVASANEHPGLRDPSKAVAEAPALFKVELDTSAGKIVIACERRWSPHGVDRFFNLVQVGYYNEVRFFRVVKNFVAQFGMHGDPAINKAWAARKMPSDPVQASNTRGAVTFAQAQDPNSRSNQLFINTKNNAGLDNQRFAPIGKVVEGMDAVDKLYAGYGDSAQGGPSQEKLGAQGNAYLAEEFPKLDFIKSARILEAAPPAPAK